MDETQEQIARKDLEIAALREELGQAINAKLELRMLVLLLQQQSKEQAENVESADKEE